MTAKRIILLGLVVLLVAGAVWGWLGYRRLRADYDAYRTKIQAGVTVAGVAVGWLTPEEARQQVAEAVAQPYFRNFRLTYLDQDLSLSPADDLALQIPVGDMVDRAVAASHRYDYWAGFWSWVRGEIVPLTLDVPLELTFEPSAAGRYLAGMATRLDLAPVEPMVDVHALTFIPGRPGHRLELEKAIALINERVADPAQREVTLPVEPVDPDQSAARVESMLATLGPVMEVTPTAPSFFTATLPLSTTGGIAGTPRLTYTGELTWTFPHFAAYTGHLTSTSAFLFEPGRPGSRFNLEVAVNIVSKALDDGVTAPIQLVPEAVAPPTLTTDLLIPPLEDLLSEFPGVSSLLVKNLDTGQVLYNTNSDLVLSGMSEVKIGIMVTVYKYYAGAVDADTHQELMDMLGSESCNPCANRLLAAVGGGSASSGAKKVTETMHQLGLGNFLLCAPFRLEAMWDGTDSLVWAASSSAWEFDLAAPAVAPRYDRCVKATPAEMAGLLEMIYLGTQGEGRLQEAFPALTPAACQDMIDIMASNDLRNMLGAGIPAEAKLAHKHGFAGYDVPWGDTRAEVGIVFSPGATYLVSFYIWDDTPWLNWGLVQPLYRDVSNILYNFFNPAQPYWPLPPWSPPPDQAHRGQRSTPG